MAMVTDMDIPMEVEVEVEVEVLVGGRRAFRCCRGCRRRTMEVVVVVGRGRGGVGSLIGGDGHGETVLATMRLIYNDAGVSALAWFISHDSGRMGS